MLGVHVLACIQQAGVAACLALCKPFCFSQKPHKTDEFNNTFACLLRMYHHQHCNESTHATVTQH